jgi:hypothetical protein
MSLDYEFPLNQEEWITLEHIWQEDNLPPEVKGPAEWVRLHSNKPGGVYGIHHHISQEWCYLKNINGYWYKLYWDNQTCTFGTWWDEIVTEEEQQQLGIGFWDITNLNHPEYQPLAPEPIQVERTGSFRLKRYEVEESPIEETTQHHIAIDPPSLTQLTTAEPPAEVMTITTPYDTQQQGGNSPPAQISMASGSGCSAHIGSMVTGGTSTNTPPINHRGLKGIPLAIFTGDRMKSDLFLKEFKQWKMLNHNVAKMASPYKWVLMALGYIQGVQVNDW